MQAILQSCSQTFHLPVYDLDVYQEVTRLTKSIESRRKRHEYWWQKKEELPRVLFPKVKKRIDAILRIDEEKIGEYTSELITKERELELGQLNLTYSSDRFKGNSTRYHFILPEGYPSFNVEEGVFKNYDHRFALIKRDALDQLVADYEHRPRASL